jgi:hypothetical protein
LKLPVSLNYNSDFQSSSMLMTLWS